MKTKKMMMTMVFALFGWQLATADEARPITMDKLPKGVVTFIETHFPGEKVSIAKVDRELFEVRYEVVLMNGAKMEFLGDGTWEEVDCRYQAVPDAVIPPEILASVKERYPECKILEINRESRTYEVKISNGLELIYDRRFHLIDIDD